MLDSNALHKPSHSPETAPHGRSLLSPQALRALLIVLVIALATFVLYLYVLPSSQIDAAKVRIAELQTQKATLERENAAVMAQIASLSDLKTLETRARALGLGPVSNTIYLRMPGSGLAPDSPASAQPDATAIEHAATTLSEWLQPERLNQRLREVRGMVSQAVDRVIQRFQAR